jgi:hypothetical protein
MQCRPLHKRLKSTTYKLALIYHRRDHEPRLPNTLIEFITMQLLLPLPRYTFNSRDRRIGVHLSEIVFETRREDPSELDEVFGSQCVESTGDVDSRS